MKRIVILFSVLISVQSHAQVKFECFDRDLKPMAEWTMPTDSLIHGDWIKITTGGVGDEPETTTHYRETTEVQATVLLKSRSARISIKLLRYVWDGYPSFAYWEGFTGSAQDQLYKSQLSIESVSLVQQEWGVPFIYQYLLKEKSLVDAVPFQARYYCRFNEVK